MRGQALALASAAMAAVMAVAPMQASAQPVAQYNTYASQDRSCQQVKQQRMIAGGIIGALTGAVLGSNVSGHGARSEGGALGAVGGAVAGGAIGRNSARCDQYSSTYNGPIGAYGQQPYQGGQYRNDRSEDGYGLDGGPGYAPTSYNGGWRGNARDCRYGEQVLSDPDGRSYRQQVYMCRGGDGVWRPQN